MADKQKATLGADKMTFWERLQFAARRRGMPSNPAYIAKIIGSNPSAITKYKHGGFPHRRNLNALAKHYDISADWLGSGLGRMMLDGVRGLEELDDQAREVLALWAALPANARERSLENLRYEKRVADLQTHGNEDTAAIEEEAEKDELRDKLTELLHLMGKKRQ